MQRLVSRVASIVAVATLLLPHMVAAEAFVDFAVGASFTENAEAKFDNAGFDGDYDGSFSTGARGGYWFDAVPWLGVGGMVSYWEPDLDFSSTKETDIYVVPVTALLMLRAPLMATEEVQRGRLQPYLNIGPGAFVTQVEDEDAETDVGLDLHAGVTWMFTSRFGMFGEYRFTYYEPNVDRAVDFYYPGGSSSQSVDFESTFSTHHFLTGFAWHFD